MKIIIFFILLLFVYFGMFFYMRNTSSKILKDDMGETHIFYSEFEFYLFCPLEYADHHLTGKSYHAISKQDKTIGKEYFVW